MIYLDSTAVVKLVHAETGSRALRDWLAQRAETGWVSSALTEVEVFRALVRHAPEAVFRLPTFLDLVQLVAIDAGIRSMTRLVQPPTVRTTNAVHLGTALRLGDQLTSFVTYDRQLANAAETAGLTVDRPTH